MTPNVPVVFDAVFDATLEMINKDFTEFPEIRIHFYQLLKAFIFNCFPAVFTFNAETIQKVMNAIQWGVRHTERTISETSLDIVYQFLQSVEQNPDFAQAFYQAHLMSLLQDILYVLTDRSHKSGFKLHATVIKHIFTIVETGKVQLPLFDPATVAATSNQAYIREYVTTILTNAFPHISKTVAQTFVSNLCVPGTDLNAFKQLLRDFLVQLKEFSGEDNAELYAEEKAVQVKAEEARRAAVPGILNPHEQDDMADL
jgi:exportin-1